MSGPNKSDRRVLGKRLKRWQFWSEIFGWAVGGGLIVEYWDEIIDCFVNWHWPSRSLVGGMLVTAGVFGEVLFSRLVLTTSDELQEHADSDVAQANERAAQAFERAADAEKVAAEANLARVRIEEALQQRIITPPQLELLKDTLSSALPSERMIFTIAAWPRLSETERFAASIAESLHAIGFNALYIIDENFVVRGDGLYVAATPDDECQTLGKAIAEGLTRIGFSGDWQAYAAEADPGTYIWKLPAHLRGSTTRGVVVVVMDKPVYERPLPVTPPKA